MNRCRFVFFAIFVFMDMYKACFHHSVERLIKDECSFLDSPLLQGRIGRIVALFEASRVFGNSDWEEKAFVELQERLVVYNSSAKGEVVNL